MDRRGRVNDPEEHHQADVAAHAERHAWTTTTEYKGQVLAQVEGNLARGDVPKNLSHATPTI